MSTGPVLRSRPPQPITLRPLRSLKNITADAVIEETHTDEMVITQHPVEEGATISDHAYRKPAELTLVYVWSMSSDQNSDNEGLTFLNSLYTELLQLKDEKVPFKIVTGKRTYENMLIASLSTTTERATENVLLIRIICQEILTVATQVVQLSDSASHAMPDKTAPVVNQGQVNLQPGTNFNGRP
jgi:dihydrofolate reductase